MGIGSWLDACTKGNPMWIQRSSRFALVTAIAGMGLVADAAHAASTDGRFCRRQSDTVTIGTLAQADEVSAIGVVPLVHLAEDRGDWPGGVVEVLDASGTLVGGEVEIVGNRFAVFRPAQPLVPSESYEVAVSGVHVRQLFRDPINGGSASEARWSFVSSDQPLTTVGERDVETSLAYRVVDDLSRGSLVCCDGAYPNRRADMTCFDNGLCGSTIGVGSLALDVAVASSAPAAPSANSFVRTIGDERIVGSDLCYSIEVLGLTSGTPITSFERCHPMPDEEIGDVDIDPLPALAKMCGEQPYVCEAEHDGEDEWRWDRDACEPVHEAEDIPGSDEDAGAGQGCRVHPRESFPLSLVLVCLGFVLARRRATPITRSCEK